MCEHAYKGLGEPLWLYTRRFETVCGPWECIVYDGDFVPPDRRHAGNTTLKALAHFDDNQRHVVSEGTVPPRSYAVEDRLLHIREW